MIELESKEKKFTSSFGPALRVLSAILVFTFLSQEIVHAQGGTPAWTHVVQTQNQAIDTSENKLNSITIPQESGITRKVVAKGAEDVIINIQDAHAKLGA